MSLFINLLLKLLEKNFDDHLAFGEVVDTNECPYLDPYSAWSLAHCASMCYIARCIITYFFSQNMDRIL